MAEPFRKPNKALKEQIADLQQAINYAVGPDFPTPDSDADRIAWLRAWFTGQKHAAPKPKGYEHYTWATIDQIGQNTQTQAQRAGEDQSEVFERIAKQTAAKDDAQ